jgi:RND family efflux transporter MFP subunit
MMMRASRLIPMALAAPLVLGACFERAMPSVQNADTPVQVVRITPAHDITQRAYAGIIRPRREAELGFRAGGRIVAREVDVGARVSAGQVLARLDPADLALQRRQAEADLASAEALLAQVGADAGRSRTLRGQGWVSVQDDEARQAAARQAQEKVNAARAALQLARNRVEYAVLRAPRDSVVTAVLADPATVVSEGQPVLRLAEAGELEAEVALPEAALAAAIDTATVTVWARPDLAIKASLRQRAAAADGRLRTYTARFALAEQPAYLAIGMTAMVTLAAHDAEPGLSLVPLAALADRGAGQAVWLVRADGGVAARPVQVRALRADAALVTGLSPGDEVVAMGVQKLDPASRVRIADRRTMVE